MENVGVVQMVFCAVVVTSAFAVRSTTGFGSAVLAVPLTALVFPLHTVIPVVANLQLMTTIHYGTRNWRSVAWKELLRIAPFMIGGVLAGLYLFSKLDGRIIAKGLGVFVIAYAIFAMLTAGHEPGAPRRMPWPVSATLNTIGALIGALFGGAASPFYAIYLNALRLSRDAFRATMTMILLVQVALRVAGYVGLGLVDTYALLFTLIAFPFMMLGARLGDVIADRITALTFNRAVGVVLLVSGTALLLK